MKEKQLVNYLHWVSLGSAAFVSAATVFTGDAKLAPYALGLISVAQVVHKFTDALDHKSTLETAVAQAASSVKL